MVNRRDSDAVVDQRLVRGDPDQRGHRRHAGTSG
jgi:hypothetical protein